MILIALILSFLYTVISDKPVQEIQLLLDIKQIVVYHVPTIYIKNTFEKIS